MVPSGPIGPRLTGACHTQVADHILLGRKAPAGLAARARPVIDTLRVSPR